MGADDDPAWLRELGVELLRLGRHRAASYPGSRLDDSAFRILMLLATAGPQTLREVADALQVDRSTASRQVTAALRHGLVERYDDPERAARLVRPTSAGREAFDHDAGLRGAVFARAMAELGTRRAQALLADLRAFNDALERALHDRV